MDEVPRLCIRGGAALFALSFSRSILSGFGTHDESWLLQVLDRVRRGDVLYRDVFFGATPLSVQVMLPAVRLLGSEIIVLRLAAASMTAGISVVCCRAAEQLGIRDREALALLGLAVALYSSPADPRPLYSQLAALGQAACLKATIAAASEESGLGEAACAGLAAGTSFAAKQNVGLTSLAALSVSLRLWRRDRRSHAVAAGAAFAAVGVGSLAPVFVGGAGRRFIEYAVTNKRRYLRLAGLRYLDGLHLLYRGGREVPLRHRYTATKFLVPPVAGLLLLGRALRIQSSTERANASLLAAHGAASILGAFPRADEEHVSYTQAPLLVGLGWAANGIRLSPATRRVVRVLAWAWLGSGVAFWFAKPWDLWRSGRARSCRLPHFNGLVEDAALIEFAQGKAEVLRELANRSPGGTFLLAPDAARYYLLSGIRNPTRYDYPYITAFGHSGERATADAIRRGEISTVMVEAGDPQLAAWELIRTTQAVLSPIADVGCTVYGPPA
jgi:hypothetical protein